MKLLSWNCQGLANPLTINALKSWCWRERPEFIFAMETMVEDKKLEVIRSQCGFDSGICLSSAGHAGGLGFWWKGWDASLVSYSSHHIMLKVRDVDGSNC